MFGVSEDVLVILVSEDVEISGIFFNTNYLLSPLFTPIFLTFSWKTLENSMILNV